MADKSTTLERILDFAIGGGILETIRFIFGRKKDGAETDRIVSDNWRDYATKLEFRFNELENEYVELRRKYYDLEEKYYELRKEVNETTHNNNGGT